MDVKDDGGIRLLDLSAYCSAEPESVDAATDECRIDRLAALLRSQSGRWRAKRPVGLGPVPEWTGWIAATARLGMADLSAPCLEPAGVRKSESITRLEANLVRLLDELDQEVARLSAQIDDALVLARAVGGSGSTLPDGHPVTS